MRASFPRYAQTLKNASNDLSPCEIMIVSDEDQQKGQLVHYKWQLYEVAKMSSFILWQQLVLNQASSYE